MKTNNYYKIALCLMFTCSLVFFSSGFVFAKESLQPPQQPEISQKTMKFNVPQVSKKQANPKRDISKPNIPSKKKPAKDELPNYPANLIENNSFQTVGNDGAPLAWNKGSWGNNDANFIFPTAGQDDDKAATVEIKNYTDGDAKWYFNEIKIEPGTRYAYSNHYKADAETQVYIRYTNNNNEFSYVPLGILPATESWKKFEATLDIPEKAVSLTIFHSLQSKGNLSVDNYSLSKNSSDSLAQGAVTLSFDDGLISQYANALPILNEAAIKGTFYIISSGLLSNNQDYYMNKDQLAEIQAAGHEIGGHSKNHPQLTQLPLDTMENEVLGSKTDLEEMGFTNINTFAYPYGEYNNEVKKTVEKSGFTAARSVDAGYNDPLSDKYALKDQNILSSTSFEEIKSWIDTANKNKTWLIIAFHQIDNGNNPYGTSPEILKQVVDYLKQTDTKVVTVAEGVKALNR